MVYLFRHLLNNLYKKPTHLILIFGSFLLVYLLFINSFVYRYDIGENLDDKMVQAISSKFIFNKVDGKFETYDKLTKKCNVIPDIDKIENCKVRYRYRGDTLANYILPSLLIRGFVYVNSSDNSTSNINQALSLGIFQGLSFTFLLCCTITILVGTLLNKKSAIFITFISFLVLVMSSNHLLEFQWHSFSELFFPIIGDGYFPTIYASRGAVSILILPVTIALLFNKSKILIAILLLSMLIHTGYSQIFAAYSLILSLLLMLLEFKKYKKTCFYILIFNILLLVYIMSQLHHSGEDIINFSLNNFSSINIIKEIKYQTILFYCFCGFILKLDFSLLLKRSIIILLSTYSFLFILESLISLNILSYSLSASNISERMNGSFMHIFVSYTIFIFFMIVKESFLRTISPISKTLVMLFVLGCFNPNFSYAKQWTVHYTDIKFLKLMLYNFKTGHDKIDTIKTDVGIYLNKYFEIEKNSHWLNLNKDKLIINNKRLKLSNLADIDIDNEFLVFLVLFYDTQI